MLFIIGERPVARIVDQRAVQCPLCGKEEQWKHLQTVNYFTLFLIRLLPLGTVADYWECPGCDHSFSGPEAVEPNCYAIIRRVLAYLMVGYGGRSDREAIDVIAERMMGAKYPQDVLNGEIRALEANGEDTFGYLRNASKGINPKGVWDIIESAYLMTYTCCEIQHEDRLRINLMGTHLGVPLEFVEAVVNRVREEGYYGIRRNLIVH